MPPTTDLRDTEPRIQRKLYRLLVKAMALTAVLAFIWVLLSPVLVRTGSDSDSDPEADDRVVRGQTVDVSRLAPGQIRELEWKGRPVWILHRTEAMRASLLATAEAALYDPDSRWSRQPREYRNVYRGGSQDYFVVVPLGTDLGCLMNLVRPEESAGQDWPGGFVDRCRQSRYDFAGRVYRDQPARRNLEVPPHRWITPGTLELLP